MTFKTLFYSLFILSSFSLKANEVASFDRVDEAHKNASNKIFRFSNYIDSFFGTKQSFDENNGSQVRLYYLITQKEYQEATFEPNIQFRFRFKELERKLTFKLEKKTRVIDVQDSQADGIVEDSLDTIKKDEGYLASVGHLSKQTKSWIYSVDLGLNIEKRSNPFIRIRTRNTLNLSPWELRFINESLYFSLDGMFNYTNFDFYKKLDEDFMFKYLNFYVWKDKEQLLINSYGPIFYQRLNNKVSISYNFRLTSVNQPNFRLSSYDIFVTYRRLLYKNWFFWDFTPGVAFIESKGFIKEGYFSTKLEVILGSF
jgi:hypothetical protein